MNLRQDAHDIWEAFVSLFVRPFDPERDGLPPLNMDKEPTRAKARKVADIGGRISIVGGVRFQENEPTGNADREWVNLDLTGQRSDRLPELTAADIAELESGGLDLVKAEQIKPLWAANFTRAAIAQKLTAEGRYGYGVDTVKRYTAAFSRAAETQELGEQKKSAG